MYQGGGDSNPQYYYPSNPNPNPNPTPPPEFTPYASAPPYSNYSAPEFPPYPSYSAPENPQFPSFQPYPPQEPPYPHLHHQQPPYYDPPNYSYEPTQNYTPAPTTASYFEDESVADGAYAYNGGGAEPYGARGTGSKFGDYSGSGSNLKFDDYGREVGGGEGKAEKQQQAAKIVRAVPKSETREDGVQKFRVKLLPEGASVTTMDVLCQIGLDGIRMLDPSTSRTLRIYPLETITRCEVLDSKIFAFWSKSSVDIEARRIRLQSNSYTTNTILDTVTAATVQLKEMGGKESLGRSKSMTDAGKQSEQLAEKKKGLVDWITLIKPGNEEKDHWVPDEAVSKCTSCATDFGAFVRRHHCRNCGDIFCDKCTQGRIALTADEQAQPVRVCDRCMAEVSQRLSNTKEIASKSTGLHSHEDLARKLQEEMEKNRKSSSGSKSSDGSGKRMREVACPICTVHLQVQVPSSGSETIECGVCQHPFLVSAH